MKLHSSIAYKKSYKIRKVNSASRIFSPSYTKYKTNNNKSLLNSMKSIKSTHNKSQINLRNKSFGFESINKINHSYRLKLLTPQSKVKISHNTNPKKVPIMFDCTSISSSIISKIENIMINYENDIMKLYSILTNFENYINKVIKNEGINIRKSLTKEDLHESKILNSKLKKNLESIEETQTNKINDSNKINISINNLLEGEQTEQDISIYKRKINKLIVKINEMESKFKIQQLNYLFCIGEYQKKVTNLEKKLNIYSIDKMPKKELKKFLCYPHNVKFDVTEDINPKSIPMFMNTKKNQSSAHDIKGNNKKLLSKSDVDIGINLLETEMKKIKDNANINNSCIDSLEEVKKKNETKFLNYDDEEEEKYIDKEIDYEEIKRMIELGKINFDSQIHTMDKFFGKSKNFFVSHPKLNYVKKLSDGSKLSSWKLENQINSLPKELSRLKMQSKSQKNAIVVFPSFLNETIANLEKLRTNKNFRSIENKFEENYKIKLKDI